MHARLFEHAGPVDVGLLVEARFELDQRDDLLAVLGRLDERAHDRAVGARGAVDGLLDREHVRIGRGLVDEGLDRRRERVVGMVHQYVALLQDPEEVAAHLAAGQHRLGLRSPRSVLQLGTVEGVEVPEAGQVERPVDDVDGGVGDLELAAEQLARLGRHGRVDLEADDPSELRAAVQDRLDGLEEVLVLVLEVEVGVAGHAEGVLRRRTSMPGNSESSRAAISCSSGRNRSPSAQRDEAREQRRDLHPGEPVVARRRVADEHGEVEREVGDVGERMGRVDRERGEDGEHALVEHLAELGPVGVVELAPVGEPDARLLERGRDVLGEDRGLALRRGRRSGSGARGAARPDRDRRATCRAHRRGAAPRDRRPVPRRTRRGSG